MANLEGTFGIVSSRDVDSMRPQSLDHVNRVSVILDFIGKHNLQPAVMDAAAIIREKFPEGDIVLGLGYDNDELRTPASFLVMGINIPEDQWARICDNYRRDFETNSASVSEADQKIWQAQDELKQNHPEIGRLVHLTHYSFKQTE